MTTKTIGIGQCALDMLAIVDGYPELDEKTEITDWDVQGGGPAATAIVALSRWGISTTFCGMIGDDSEGHKIRSDLEKEGINVQHLIPNPNIRSQLSFIAIDRSTGKRTIFCRRTKSVTNQQPEIARNELPINILDGAKLLLLDGVMNDISITIAKEARTKQIPILLDAGRVRERSLELANLCDHVVGSSVFAKQVGFNPDSQNPENFFQTATKLAKKAVTFTFVLDFTKLTPVISSF
jgi:ribokinase